MRAAAAREPSPLLSGTQLRHGAPRVDGLERYAMGEVIGAGSFGTTIEARDRETGHAVVLKRLSIAGLPAWKPFELFERETKVLRALDHPGVPRFIDAFEAELEGETAFYLVSERIEGRTLAAVIASGVRWRGGDARQLVLELLETLEYLHTLSPRVIHRDIKPSNIMLTGEGRPVLIDFGAVRGALQAAGSSPTIVGTVGYMAPEQAMGAADPRSDLYGLAATIVHVLTHVHPSEFPRDGLHSKIRELAGIEEPMVSVLERMLEPDPDARFPDAKAVREALLDPGTLVVRDGERAHPVAKRRESGSALAIPDAPRPLIAAMRRQYYTRGVPMVMGGEVSILLVAIALFGAVLGFVGVLRAGPMALAVALSALVPLFLVVAAKAKKRVRRLFQRGSVASGRIQKISASPGAPGHEIVRYTYVVGSETHKGKLVTRDRDVQRRIERGAPVYVFYDAEKPRQHVALLEPELEPEAT